MAKRKAEGLPSQTLGIRVLSDGGVLENRWLDIQGANP
jgi:hypothetical protein